MRWAESTKLRTRLASSLGPAAGFRPNSGGSGSASCTTVATRIGSCGRAAGRPAGATSHVEPRCDRRKRRAVSSSAHHRTGRVLRAVQRPFDQFVADCSRGEVFSRCALHPEFLIISYRRRASRMAHHHVVVVPFARDAVAYDTRLFVRSIFACSWHLFFSLCSCSLSLSLLIVGFSFSFCVTLYMFSIIFVNIAGSNIGVARVKESRRSLLHKFINVRPGYSSYV